jgi:uncharacterized protein (DUF433 family)
MQPARSTSDPKVMFGKPIVAGTRITVRCLVAGETPDDIAADYRLTTSGSRRYSLQTELNEIK